MMESILNHIRKLRVELLLILSLLGLMFFGATFILSAAIDQYEIEPLLNTYFFRQVGFYIVGLTLGVFLSWWIIIAWLGGRERLIGSPLSC